MSVERATRQPVIEPNPMWQQEFFELLRIPSVSADPGHAPDVWAMARWAESFITQAGGTTEIVADGHLPITIGRFTASNEPTEAPTVLLYAHADVQPAGDDKLWDSPAFEPEVRDGLVYARGSSDDKSSLYIIARVVADLAREGRLPVNVLIVFDGDEEYDGKAVVDWVSMDETRVDVAVVLDGLMLSEAVPMLTVGARGLLQFTLKVTTGEQDLHSGLYGGVGLNAIHALNQIIGALIFAEDQLAEGAVAFSARQLADWDAVADGADLLRLAGGRPVSEEAISNYHRQIFARPSLSVNGISGGEVQMSKTIIPIYAEASCSVRLAPGQDPDRVWSNLTDVVNGARPEGCEARLSLKVAESGSMTNPNDPFVRAAVVPLKQVFGNEPVLLPMGASVPILSALARRGIPAVQTGFGLPDGNFHAPNERFPLNNLWLGMAAIREMLFAFARVSEPEELVGPD